MNVILLCALLTGAGLWLVVRGIPRPSARPDLTTWLAGRRRRLAAPALTPATDAGSPVGAVLAPLLRDMAGVLVGWAERAGLGGHQALARRLALVGGAASPTTTCAR